MVLTDYFVIVLSDLMFEKFYLNDTIESPFLQQSLSVDAPVEME